MAKTNIFSSSYHLAERSLVNDTAWWGSRGRSGSLTILNISLMHAHLNMYLACFTTAIQYGNETTQIWMHNYVATLPENGLAMARPARPVRVPMPTVVNCRMPFHKGIRSLHFSKCSATESSRLLYCLMWFQSPTPRNTQLSIPTIAFQ